MKISLALILLVAAPAMRIGAAPTVEPNDNLKSAGQLQGNVLAIRMYAGMGTWRPKAGSAAPIEIAAFGEEGGSLSTPGPLIRARAGTTVVVTLRNALDAELSVFGLCSRPGPCEPVTIGAGASRQVRFSLNVPGTYHYWGSRSAATLAERPAKDSQIGGAIVVDAADAPRDERVMVIGLFVDAEGEGSCINVGSNAAFTINGASWPYTSRLHYKVGETAHWRVINLSCDQHAMHLHGFHFVVDAAGDGLVDRQLSGADRRTEVTEALVPGRTMSLAWTPTRAGNWIFHCHMVAHMMRPSNAHTPHGDMADDAGMAGLVIGIEVAGPEEPPPAVAARRLTMTLNEDPDRYGKGSSGYRVELEGENAPRVSEGPVPGPLLILRRGEPTEITVVNRTTQPTAIHWHGIEIESYFDGVPGFGGRAGQVAPPIAPGESFVAKMTPPRAGTYMYHTHWHDNAQLAGGMYGPLLVLEPGEEYDPAVDHILMIGFNGVDRAGQREPFALNGRATPDPIRLRAGVPNRLRLINITANNVALTASLVGQFETMQWRLVAKDGAAVTGDAATLRLARQLVSVGETYDFEITPPVRPLLWFDFRRGNGEWVLQAPIQVR